MAPNFTHDSARAEADARKTSEGSAQLLQIDAQMNGFVEGVAGNSKGRFIESINVFNGQKALAIANLGKAFDEFALGEGKFAKLTDLYDEEAQV
jgi:hypothetical protein